MQNKKKIRIKIYIQFYSLNMYLNSKEEKTHTCVSLNRVMENRKLKKEKTENQSMKIVEEENIR